MSILSYTTTTGQVVSVDSTGSSVTSGVAAPTISVVPAYGSVFTPDYLLDSPMASAPVNHGRAGVRVANPAPTSAVTVSTSVIFKHPA